ncbi:MAG: hypothetical protein HZB50_10285 [Chloroflexi bacterium]|nr:hypothetical protein [Chloroflexota bacterium]
MTEIDKRHVLDNKIFTYRTIKEDKVFIYWYEKQVTILKGKEAQRFIGKIRRLNDQEAQLVMAKITGNFKRGNER